MHKDLVITCSECEVPSGREEGRREWRKEGKKREKEGEDGGFLVLVKINEFFC